MQNKPKLSFWQIWNMSFGFLGIQFGYALQGGFMSRIFETLGADEHSLPLLWIAAPLTGLIVQPIIGQMSDNTWHPRFGRRRPYFLIGAVLASLTLLVVPHSSALWMAAGGLWILDATMNISMEPFRALVADKLPDSQRSFGFVVQTLIIGVSTWVASNLPLMVSSLGVSNEAAPGVVPMSVQVAFGIGAAVFILSILYTVFTTDEYPPEDMEAFRAEQKEKSGLANTISEVFKNIADMPKTMKRLGVVQFFSWFAFFCMWSMANPALTDHVFNAAKPEAIDFAVSTAEQIDAYQIADRAFNDFLMMLQTRWVRTWGTTV
jgi:maltose/moltooligosaccharide transporter